MVSQPTIVRTQLWLSRGSETRLGFAWAPTHHRMYSDLDEGCSRFGSIHRRALCRLRRLSEAGYRVLGRIFGHGVGAVFGCFRFRRLTSEDLQMGRCSSLWSLLRRLSRCLSDRFIDPRWNATIACTNTWGNSCASLRHA
jgi:hypothetical protein